MRPRVLAFLLIVGVAVPSGGPARAGVPRISTSGSRLWVARFDARAQDVDRATSLVTSADGSMVFVVGTSWDGNVHDYVTVAYRTSGGEEFWRARRAGPHEGYLATESLAVSPDGGLVFISVAVPTRSGHTVTATIAYRASSGALVWERRHPARLRDLAVSPDGTSVFLTGSVGDAFGMSDYATVAYDAATGAELWERTYGRDGASPSWHGASAIAVSPDGGRVFVSGDSSQNTVTLAYDARTGSTLWRARLRIIDGQQVVDMAVSPDGGRVFVTGHTIRELAQWATSATVAYDARTGQEIWETGSASPETPAFVTSMAVSPDSGIVFIAGGRIGTGDYFVAVTTAFDAASGDMLWGRRYSGELGFSTTANSIVAGPDGSTVYVTGATGRSRNADYATLAYDAVSGADVWVRRFEGSGDGYDQANAIAMDPAGTRVFVTGQSEGSTSLDYVTVAYSA